VRTRFSVQFKKAELIKQQQKSTFNEITLSSTRVLISRQRFSMPADILYYVIHHNPIFLPIQCIVANRQIISKPRFNCHFLSRFDRPCEHDKVKLPCVLFRQFQQSFSWAYYSIPVLDQTKGFSSQTPFFDLIGLTETNYVKYWVITLIPSFVKVRLRFG